MGLLSKGYEQITDVSSATGLTVPSGSTVAWVQVETQDCRMRDDGTSPTSSVGMLLKADTWYELKGSLAQVEIIEAAASASVNIMYWGES